MEKARPLTLTTLELDLLDVQVKGPEGKHGELCFVEQGTNDSQVIAHYTTPLKYFLKLRDRGFYHWQIDRIPLNLLFYWCVFMMKVLNMPELPVELILLIEEHLTVAINVDAVKKRPSFRLFMNVPLRLDAQRLQNDNCIWRRLRILPSDRRFVKPVKKVNDNQHLGDWKKAFLYLLVDRYNDQYDDIYEYPSEDEDEGWREMYVENKAKMKSMKKAKREGRCYCDMYGICLRCEKEMKCDDDYI